MIQSYTYIYIYIYIHILFHILFKIFIYLAALDLSCGIQDLNMWHGNS